jgi:prepilin peptidase CpaA
MLILLVFLSTLFASVAILALAAISDFKSFTIPNVYSVALILFFIPSFCLLNFLAGDVQIFSSFASHVFAFLIILGVTVLLYALKLLGAGDSKFMAAVGLWLGLSGLIPFLFYMSLAGGVLAGITLYLNKHSKFPNALEGSWFFTAQKGDQRLPYGMAIGFGAVMAFFMNGYFNPQTWALLVQ